MDIPARPPAPDPVATAQAQGSENLRAARQQYGLNATNQVTPYGTLNYAQDGNWEDGTPRYTATTSLSPTAQDTIDKTIGVQNKFAGLAGDQLDKAKGILSTNFTLPGGDFKLPDPTSLSADRGTFENALLDRNQPQMVRDRAALTTSLKNQGFDYGSDAWNKAMDDENRKENDFRLGVYSQGSGDYLANRAQQTNEALTGRQQQINEALTERNQPLTELSTLMTGASPKMPTFQSTPQSSINPVDVAGLYGQQWQGQMQGWQNQNAMNQAMMGGAFGLAGAGLGGWARGGFSMGGAGGGGRQ